LLLFLFVLKLTYAWIMNISEYVDHKMKLKGTNTNKEIKPLKS
jgi:hypothetical protein